MSSFHEDLSSILGKIREIVGDRSGSRREAAPSASQSNPNLSEVEFRNGVRRDNLPHFAQQQLGELERLKHWESGDLANFILIGSIHQQYPVRYPDSIDLGKLRERLGTLGIKTKSEKVEWGQVGFAHVEDRKVYFHEDPQRGKETSVSIEFGAYPPGVNFYNSKPAIMLHSHPYHFTEGLYFSPKDYVSFLSNVSLAGTALIHQGRVLLALRTNDSTHSLDNDALSRNLDELKNRARIGAGSGAVVQRRFNEMTAHKFNLLLFYASVEEPLIARQVKLRAV